MSNSQQRQMKFSARFQAHIVFSELSQGQAVLCQFNPHKRRRYSLYRIKGGIPMRSFSVTFPDLQGLRSKPNSCLPSSKLPAQMKNSEPVYDCASNVSVIPFTVVPSHHLDGSFLPTAEIACGTGMQYGPEQFILVSICQNTIFRFYNADC